MYQNKLNRLNNVFKLSSRVTIYVPATINTNETIDNTTYVNETATLLSNCFGGATSTPAVGYWVSDAEGLVIEKSTMVFAYCTDTDLNNHFDEVLNHCYKLKNELNQEAIALEINGEMYFIS